MRRFEIDALRVAAAVAAVESTLGPDVTYIRWEFGPDWSTRMSLFFRVVLSDDACAHRLSEVARRVREALGGYALGDVFGYVNFRSESECKTVNDPEWQRS